MDESRAAMHGQMKLARSRSQHQQIARARRSTVYGRKAAGKEPVLGVTEIASAQGIAIREGRFGTGRPESEIGNPDTIQPDCRVAALEPERRPDTGAGGGHYGSDGFIGSALNIVPGPAPGPPPVAGHQLAPG